MSEKTRAFLKFTDKISRLFEARRWASEYEKFFAGNIFENLGAVGNLGN